LNPRRRRQRVFARFESATLSGVPPLLVGEIGPQTLVSHFVDLGVVVPALIVAGGWLWRRCPWGDIFAGVALVFDALLAPTITGMTIVSLVGGSVTVPPVALAFTVLPAAIATVLAVTYLLAIPGSGLPAADERTQPTRVPHSEAICLQRHVDTVAKKLNI
jgi:hypothetical protein